MGTGLDLQLNMQTPIITVTQRSSLHRPTIEPIEQIVVAVTDPSYKRTLSGPHLSSDWIREGMAFFFSNSGPFDNTSII